MKILFIIPGAGDSFYCGNCFRDNLQANALRKAGYNVIIMPLYLPLKHKSFLADTPLFFPATTYYAEQKLFSKGKMPKWMERLTSSNVMLKFASSMSGTTSAEGMEGMTISMIKGEDAAFQNQVSRIIEWIKNHEKPDIIHLSSSLLIGIAKAIRQAIDIPIVCSLQDEEVWINTLNVNYIETAWNGIADNIHFINRFVTSSEFYKSIVLEKFPQIKEIEVIYPGIDTNKYISNNYPKHPTIGFFYRMNRENGLDILAEAFVLLKKEGVIPNLKLKIGGGYTGKDKTFLKKVKKILVQYIEDVEFCHNYNLDEHTRFYSSISVISVPLTFDEGFGLYLCEAFAVGRPAVVPATGSFPEIVEDGGILYHPNNSENLAQALKKLLTDKDLYQKTALKAKKLSEIRYNEKILAEKLGNMYNFVV